jgi:hypothetical protein
MPDNITPISELNNFSSNAEQANSSDSIPPSLVPFVKIIIGGLALVAILIALALFKDRLPSVFNRSDKAATPASQTALLSNVSQPFSNQEFSVKLPDEFTQKTLGNQILLFADSQAADTYATCTQDSNEQNNNQCGLMMSVAIEAFSPDHDFSLEKTQSDQKTYSPFSTTYVDAFERQWLIEPINSSDLGVIAETKTDTALHQATIVINTALYQEKMGTDITPDRFLELIKSLLSTIEFTNQ